MPNPAAPERTDLVERLRAATDVAETPEDLVEVSVMLLGEAADALEDRDSPDRDPQRAERGVGDPQAIERLWAAFPDSGRFDETVSVSSGDLYYALTRAGAVAPAGERDRYDYLPCERCGADCGMDAVVPHDVWRRVSPNGDESGMLCLWCIDTRCAEEGIPGPVDAQLFFTGRVVRSALPANPSESDQPDPEGRRP